MNPLCPLLRGFPLRPLRPLRKHFLNPVSIRQKKVFWGCTLVVHRDFEATLILLPWIGHVQNQARVVGGLDRRDELQSQIPSLALQ